MQLNVNNATRNKIIKGFIYCIWFQNFLFYYLKKIYKHLIKIFVVKAFRKKKI